MKAREEDLTLPRLRLFTRLCFVWGAIILLRLIHLQIIKHDDFVRLAQQQQERQIEVRAPRGTILDRNGQPLAMSVAVDSVCVNPMRIPDIPMAADILARVLDLNAKELGSKIQSARDDRKGFLWVKRKISLDESKSLRNLNMEWIEFRQESSRFYPKGGVAAHVLGGVDHEERGNGGIERYFDKDLTGKPGLMRTTADVRQNVFDWKVFSDPQPGATFTLSIDERIQLVAERALAKAVKEHNANTGSVVVMDPKNGDIIALANYPTYDPNVPPQNEADAKARMNLAVMAPFEPGSVFKVITMSTALETTKLTPASVFHCGNGAFTLFRRVIHDAHPHGALPMSEILARSSNIGSIKIALVAGNQNMYDYVKKFGFGERTGISLPGEARGVVRKLDRWIASSIGSVAMGHEISTTAVQLARASAVVANGGMLVKPRVVTKVARNGEAPQDIKVEMQRILKPETAKEMRVMMQGVVDLPHGTGKAARLKGYTSAGKTGSAQIFDFATKKYTHRYNGSFMGFAPVNNPALVVAVTLNNTAKYGGVVAGPVFHEIMTAALRILDVPRDRVDDETGPTQPEAANDASDPDPEMIPVLEDEEDKAMLLAASGNAKVIGPELPPEMAAMAPTGPKAPDFRGKSKRDVIAASMETGVRVEMRGLGVARRQNPPPGTMLQPGERVRVVFSR